MAKCDWCGIENDDKFTVVIVGVKPDSNVCAKCMNLYANQEFDKLIERIEKRLGGGLR